MDTKMQYNILISQRAYEGIGAIISFIADSDAEAAKHVKNEILYGIRSLKDFPERTPFLSGAFIPYNKYHKLIILDRYLILYQIQDAKVLVEFVLDGRQDYRWLLR